jgi:hypothetical protein
MAFEGCVREQWAASDTKHPVYLGDFASLMSMSAFGYNVHYFYFILTDHALV